MPAHPVKVRTPPLARHLQAPPVIHRNATPFLQFQYSYSELTMVGDKAHVKSRRTRLEDGKLTSEAFEGELPADVYGEMVAEAKRRFLAQSELLLRSLALFLPRL